MWMLFEKLKKNEKKILIYTIKKKIIKSNMANKLENLLSFDDFEKNWSAKSATKTKHTEVGLDIVNENLYMKVMDQQAAGWKANCDKFVESIKKAVKDNQAKDIEVSGDSVSFKIRGRKHKINKESGAITLWRVKANSFRKTTTDSAGRVREDKKRQKTREDIEVNIPISKSDASAIYNDLKEKVED
jgi:hypothetical protein